MAQQETYSIYLTHQLEMVWFFIPLVQIFGKQIQNWLMALWAYCETNHASAPCSKIGQCATFKTLQHLHYNSELADIFQRLKKFLDNGVGRSYLILNLRLLFILTSIL
jgi:hypothetical protein